MPLSPTNWLDVVQAKLTSLPHCGGDSSQERTLGVYSPGVRYRTCQGSSAASGGETCHVWAHVREAAMGKQRGQRGGEKPWMPPRFPPLMAPATCRPGSIAPRSTLSKPGSARVKCAST